MPSFFEIGSLVTIYAHDGHLGRVSWIIYIYIGSYFLQMLGLVNKYLRKNKTQIFQAKWQKLQFSAFRLISQWKL